MIPLGPTGEMAIYSLPLWIFFPSNGQGVRFIQVQIVVYVEPTGSVTLNKSWVIPEGKLHVTISSVTRNSSGY